MLCWFSECAFIFCDMPELFYCYYYYFFPIHEIGRQFYSTIICLLKFVVHFINISFAFYVCNFSIFCLFLSCFFSNNLYKKKYSELENFFFFLLRLTIDLQKKVKMCPHLQIKLLHWYRIFQKTGILNDFLLLEQLIFFLKVIKNNKK